MTKPVIQTIMRSDLGRARGLGAGKGGTAHWLAERLTALALVPLTLWFVYSMVSLLGAPRAAAMAWAGHTVNATLLIALLLITFKHLTLGVQVIMEDYIHSEGSRFASILAMKAVAGLFCIAGVLATIKLALAG